MTGKKDISASDSELFRQSVGPVNKIRQKKSLLPKRQKRRVSTGISHSTTSWNADTVTTIDTVGMGDVLSFRRPGVQQRLLSRLKRGQYAVEAELDLHGMTSAKGQESLLAYLDYCRQEGLRCIRVIHGKGHGSRDKKPVIKNMLNTILRNHDTVLAFTSASVNDGGTGAVYVLLRGSHSHGKPE